MTTQSRTPKDFDLRGKVYFTVDEAAHFACVSNSQFRAKAVEYGIRPFPWMGKQVYKRADLERAMERASDWADGTDRTDPPPHHVGGFQILRAMEARSRARKERRAQLAAERDAAAKRE